VRKTQWRPTLAFVASLVKLITSSRQKPLYPSSAMGLAGLADRLEVPEGDRLTVGRLLSHNPARGFREDAPRFLTVFTDSRFPNPPGFGGSRFREGRS
jgi:hypothetical protein